MLKLGDRFKKPTENEEREHITKREAALAHANETIALARACLESTIFQKYKRSYEKAKEQLILAIENYEEEDPLKYAFGMNQLTTKLRDIGSLLKDVVRDAGKKEIRA